MTFHSKLRAMTKGLGARAGRFVERLNRGGQAMVEFALIAVLALVVMLVGIQFAIIGQAALAVSQASFLGARTAAVNETMTQSQLQTAIANEISPTIGGANITLTNTTDPTCSAGTGNTRTFGCPISVTVTYNASGKVFLPANTLMGITFPTNLTATESAMTE